MELKEVLLNCASYLDCVTSPIDAAAVRKICLEAAERIGELEAALQEARAQQAEKAR